MKKGKHTPSIFFILAAAVVLSLFLSVDAYAQRLAETDRDSDGVPDSSDNCPSVPNRDQADSDATPAASDGKGDACDNCPYSFNPDQTDADDDGIGDACDNCAEDYNPSQDNTDDDTFGSACDNCPDDYNEDQKDTDGNGIGDQCDEQINVWTEPKRPEPNTKFKIIAEYMIEVSRPYIEIEVNREKAKECDTARCEYEAGPFSDGFTYRVRYRDSDETIQATKEVTPLQAPKDSDYDKIFDILDNCPTDANTDQKDTDEDGYGDACDTCKFVVNSQKYDDPDNDGYGEPCDNCPEIYNPDQKNSDTDKYGDECDSCPKITNPNQEKLISDWDDDGIGNECDNCEDHMNVDQKDADNDGLGDACDPCPNIFTTEENRWKDADHDQRGDACDNCPNAWNKDQKDANNNGKGDVCDPCPIGTKDTDKDKIDDECDTCPNDALNACNLCTMSTLSYPSYFNWKHYNGKNYMTPVRDQGACGSCYTMAPIGVIEAVYNIEKKQSMNLNLSEQQFVAGCFNNVGSCYGGQMGQVMDHIKNDGAYDENCMYYNSGNCVYDYPDPDNYGESLLACKDWCDNQKGGCSNPTYCSKCYNPTTYKINKYEKVTNITNYVKKGLACHGPLAVCSPNWWHCVVLVGWEGNNWIVKNSWGVGWEDYGYGKIPMQGHEYSEIINDAWYMQGVNP